jgi:hypothetical protein
MTGSPPAPPRAASSATAARPRFAIVIGLFGMAGLAVAAAAQTPPAAPAITRTVVAGTKLTSLDNTPVYFRAVSVSILMLQRSARQKTHKSRFRKIHADSGVV